MNKSLIIGVTGGKGGTGKSTIAVSLAISYAESGMKVFLVDSDVESPVEHILLSLDRVKLDEIKSFRPIINHDKCVKCNLCVDNCPEHALMGLPGRIPKLIPELCNGCKACYYVCPVNAIEEDYSVAGEIYEMNLNGLKILQGELKPGFKQYVNATVSTINKAIAIKENFDIVIIDTAPGTGANIYAALSQCDIVIAVTEPTRLGANDLSMLLDLAKKIGKPAYIILNKATMPGGKRDLIYDIANKYGVPVIAEVPYDQKIMSKYFRGEFSKTIDKSQRELFRGIAVKIINLV